MKKAWFEDESGEDEGQMTRQKFSPKPRISPKGFIRDDTDSLRMT